MSSNKLSSSSQSSSVLFLDRYHDIMISASFRCVGIIFSFLRIWLILCDATVIVQSEIEKCEKWLVGFYSFEMYMGE